MTTVYCAATATNNASGGAGIKDITNSSFSACAGGNTMWYVIIGKA